jgi:SMP-30/Gluconolactonase/LRE-like region
MKRIVTGLQILLPIVSMAQATIFKMLPVGPGPEDICIAEWRGEQIAIVACSERRKGKTFEPSKLGFHFIGLRHGVPTEIGSQSIEELGIPLSWAGLHWQPLGIPGARSGVLAAARTGCFLPSEKGRLTFNEPSHDIDLFEWEPHNSKPRLRRLQNHVPKAPTGWNKGSFNAVALSANGDVYATAFGMFNLSCRPPDTTVASAEFLKSHSLYRWEYETCQWQRVASHIPGANGLSFSADGHQLAVAGYIARKIYWFELKGDPAGGLRFLSSVRFEGWNPDNLRSVPGGIAACGSHKVSTGVNLISEVLLGWRAFKSAPGAIALVNPSPGQQSVQAFQNLPADYQCPSGIGRLGGYWIATQLLDDKLLLWPANPHD